MLNVYFGTYTKRNSKGIYAAKFDTNAGQLSDLTLIVKEDNPTYLTFSNKGFLYSTTKSEKSGGIASYDNNFNPLNRLTEKADSLCYIAVDDRRNLVFGADYHEGKFMIYGQNDDGSLRLLNQIKHTGVGPHPNQDRARVHFSDLTPDCYLVTCDLGTDSVTTYEVSPSGQVTQIGNYQATSGAGARHLIFHCCWKIAYLICELNSTIEVLFFDGQGQFEHYHTISTIPNGYTGFNACAAIRMSLDGRFVYASNRGHNSIAVFEVIGDGALRLRQIISTFGKTPRDFDLSPDNCHLIVVHQDSDNVTVFSRDKQTGILREINHDFYLPEAVCITFSAH